MGIVREHSRVMSAHSSGTPLLSVTEASSQEVVTGEELALAKASSTSISPVLYFCHEVRATVV